MTNKEALERIKIKYKRCLVLTEEDYKKIKEWLDR